MLNCIVCPTRARQIIYGINSTFFERHKYSIPPVKAKTLANLMPICIVVTLNATPTRIIASRSLQAKIAEF